ncbi:MAG: adenine phosphoribosyltransferase [Candidatus Micrarchaeota archaeon]
MKAELVAKIRTVPNWPKNGIMFRDITTLLKDKEGFRHMLDLFCERYRHMDIDIVAGVESRGFIIGAAVADRLGKGFIPIRKAGKLPAKIVSAEYALEYGTDRIEMHHDAIVEGAKVLLVDDLIATGGTALAACELIKELNGRVVECGFIINLKNLPGKEKLERMGYKVASLLDMEG